MAPNRIDVLKAQVVEAVPKIAVMVVDIQEKVRIYLDTFGTAMKTLKLREPKVWAEILAATKLAYQEDPNLPNVAVEMLAANMIEYQDALTEGKVSALSTQLLEFSKANNLLFR